jgi:hypothetical protein
VLAITRKVWLRLFVAVRMAQLLPLVVAAGGAGAGAGELVCWLGVDDRRVVEAWEGTVTVTVWTTGVAVSWIGSLGPGSGAVGGVAGAVVDGSGGTSGVGAAGVGTR